MSDQTVVDTKPVKDEPMNEVASEEKAECTQTDVNTKDETMEVAEEPSVVTEDATVTKVEYPPNVHKVHRQLLAIFDPENIKKDNFFRELVERDPEHWVPIKKLSMIKRFKEILEGDVSLFEQAIALAPQDFELNEEKTQLRYIKKEAEAKKDNHADNVDKKAAHNQQVILSHFEVQNKRSIYSKGFTIDPEPTEAELKAFYGTFGRVLALRHRREGAGNKRNEGPFKGSIFVEFETPEIAQKVVEEATTYNEMELTNMIKGDYVEMKRVEKYSDAEYSFSHIAHRHLVEYSNGQEHSFKEIKELVKTVANVGRLEPLETKGTGVLEIFKTTPEEFLAKLKDQKLESINFCLVSAAARTHFNKIQKEAAKNGRGNGRGGGRGGRGNGRGGRGSGGRGRGGRHGDNNNQDGRKRGNDNPNNEEINKRARTIVEVKASAITAPTK